VNRFVALYGHWICPFVTRVRFALAQRGIEHDLVNVPPSGVRPRDFVLPDEFVEHSPRLEVPMVRVRDERGDDYLADSIPILDWLEQRIDAEPLVPGDAAAARVVRERMAWIDERVFRPMIGVYYGVEPERVDRASEALGRALAEMGEALARSGWLVGDGPTLAEAVLVPLYVRLDGLRQLGFAGDLSDQVETHRRQVRELAGWSSVEWSDDQSREFVDRMQTFRRRRRSAMISG
jgi:glutathione S-transferase